MDHPLRLKSAGMPQRAQRHCGRPSKMPRVQALNLRSSQAADATNPNDVVDKDDNYGADWDPYQLGDEESEAELEDFALMEDEGAMDLTKQLVAFEEGADEEWSPAKKRKTSELVQIELIDTLLTWAQSNPTKSKAICDRASCCQQI